MRRLSWLSFFIAGIAACSSSTLEAPPPLSVSIEASRTTVVAGDTITFTVNALGGNLFGVEINFGDSGTDQYGASGARSARVTFRHAYATSGTFTVRATATDALSGQKDATVDIHVN